MPQNRLLITASCLLTILMLLGVTAAAASTEIDYAESRFVDSWQRHPV
jgi:hypothetical protein